MSEEKTYAGSCHCGKVRFEAKTALSRVLSCNCSICAKTGALLIFVPEENFKLQSGEEVLTDYQFAKKRIHHFFCSTCGIRSFARGTAPDGRKMAAVNVRCLEDVNLDALSVTPFDGKSL